MKRLWRGYVGSGVFILFMAALSACATAYKAQPLPFKSPASYANATQVAGAVIGAEAYVDADRAGRLFGFDVRGAGLLPVQVVFDHKGSVPLAINPGQTFLEDDQGNLWPVLNSDFAYERVSKYAQTKQVFSKGAYSGFLGGVAGALLGAAVGVVSGEDVGEAVGKGAVVGAATGAVMGGTAGLVTAEEASQRVMSDFEDKSLQNKPIKPGDLAYGFIFFPGEATSAARLRLQLVEKKDQQEGQIYSLEMKLK